MCNGCVQKEYPDRGNTCLENGSYLMNYLGCANCHQRDFVLISNKATEDEDGEEIVTYDHVCKNCDHVIARHEYTFSVVDEYQRMFGTAPVWRCREEYRCRTLNNVLVWTGSAAKALHCLASVLVILSASPNWRRADRHLLQEYTMLCMLCGKAEDSISVLPDDPRQSAPLF